MADKTDAFSTQAKGRESHDYPLLINQAYHNAVQNQGSGLTARLILIHIYGANGVLRYMVESGRDPSSPEGYEGLDFCQRDIEELYTFLLQQRQDHSRPLAFGPFEIPLANQISLPQHVISAYNGFR